MSNAEEMIWLAQAIKDLREQVTRIQCLVDAEVACKEELKQKIFFINKFLVGKFGHEYTPHKSGIE